MQPPIAESTTSPSQFRTFPCRVPPSHTAAINHFFTHWQRGTIFAATYDRIHDKPKPVQNLPLQSPTKPQGSDVPFFHQQRRTILSPTGKEEPLLQPQIAESTTIPRQCRTLPCIVPRSHQAAMNRRPRRSRQSSAQTHREA